MLRASATKIRVKGKGKGKKSSQSIAPTQPVLNPSDPILGTPEQGTEPTIDPPSSSQGTAA